jgi:hypothetical protein
LPNSGPAQKARRLGIVGGAIPWPRLSGFRLVGSEASKAIGIVLRPAGVEAKLAQCVLVGHCFNFIGIFYHWGPPINFSVDTNVAQCYLFVKHYFTHSKGFFNEGKTDRIQGKFRGI